MSGSIAFIIHQAQLCGPHQLYILDGHHLVHGGNAVPEALMILIHPLMEVYIDIVQVLESPTMDQICQDLQLQSLDIESEKQ